MSECVTESNSQVLINLSFITKMKIYTFHLPIFKYVLQYLLRYIGRPFTLYTCMHNKNCIGSRLDPWGPLHNVLALTYIADNACEQLLLIQIPVTVKL